MKAPKGTAASAFAPETAAEMALLPAAVDIAVEPLAFVAAAVWETLAVAAAAVVAAEPKRSTCFLPHSSALHLPQQTMIVHAHFSMATKVAVDALHSTR